MASDRLERDPDETPDMNSHLLYEIRGARPVSGAVALLLILLGWVLFMIAIVAFGDRPTFGTVIGSAGVLIALVGMWLLPLVRSLFDIRVWEGGITQSGGTYWWSDIENVQWRSGRISLHMRSGMKRDLPNPFTRVTEEDTDEIRALLEEYGESDEAQGIVI